MLTTLLILEGLFLGFFSGLCFLSGPSLDGLNRDMPRLDIQLCPDENSRRINAYFG